MKEILRFFRSRAVAFTHDLLMVPIAWLGAYWLRFNLERIPDPLLLSALTVLPGVMIVQGAVFWYFGLYRGVWRFASMPDLIRITKAVVFGVSLTAVAIFLLTRMEGIPRAVFPLYGIFLLILLGGPRFIYRWLKDHSFQSATGRKSLIVGAGLAGEMLARDLLRSPGGSWEPMSFVDDDPTKQGREIHGIRVSGLCDKIPEVVARHEIELILIALPSATSKQIQRIVELCEKTGKPFRILPRLQDLVSGQASIRDLRDVRIEDLLGRESVSLDWTSITRGVQGKTILVTGGGGSIGTELCRQVARLKPAHLVIFEQSEFNLYSIELELRQTFPDLRLTVLLGDIYDAVAVEQMLRAYRPTVILHAAAYKHVPMLEHQLRAAVKNNALGTRTLGSLAERHGCATFVMISTDKAVNPANIMGMTKRVAEIFCQNLSARSSTHFITVRFGNVLGSAGSVIPLFQKQIAAGGPVMVTHPEITRYFMTIPEAAQLILQAGTMGRGGEIFVLDMGEPVKIAYLAEQLIHLSGKKPGEDIEIVYTGLRPGEKLYEELFHESENLTGTTHPKILLANSRGVDFTQLEQTLDKLATACEANDERQIYGILSELVPEHQSRLSLDMGAGGGKSAVVVPLKNPDRSS